MVLDPNRFDPTTESIVRVRLDQERVSPGIPLRGYDAKLHSTLTSIDTGQENKVQQHLGVEVDINTIMRRFGVTRELPLGPASGVYGDFTGISDYESAVERIEGATAKFMELPPEVRERFKNDPGELIRMAQNLEPESFNAMFSRDPVPAVPVVPDPVVSVP